MVPNHQPENVLMNIDDPSPTPHLGGSWFHGPRNCRTRITSERNLVNFHGISNLLGDLLSPGLWKPIPKFQLLRIVLHNPKKTLSYHLVIQQFAMENHNFLIGKPSNYFYGPSKNHGYVTNNQVGYMLVINQFPSSMILPLTNRVEMRRNTRAGALVGTLSASFPRPPCAAPSPRKRTRS